ncbi:Endoribonuclease YBEY, chloroplastic [Sesamum angolense]|uniref:Endoribonuclease YBEY, chloroplastic n=1 Tax=Sesamum angolense TaxID=2727404 RepID=A0AAE1W8N0_9LAMI|nr:Endoribonuclease YBEY, chloroplastic [Sesamum angolense]
MVSRLSPLLRALPPPSPSPMAARVLSLALPYVVARPSKLPPSPPPQCLYLKTSCFEAASFVGRRRFNGINNSYLGSQFGGRNGNVAVPAARREYRKVRSRKVAAAKKSKEKELELSVKICLEEQLPEDPEILLMLGDIVISVETAARQAEERGHALIDEIRILVTGREKAVSVFTDQNLATSSVTWMTRRAAIDVLKTANLAGRDGIISEFSPGVFIQALLYSLKHEVPIIAFSDDRCLTLFEHPLVDLLHTVYHEPKAEIIPSVEQFVAGVEIQVMAIGDGENDVEMLKLASLVLL